MTIPFDVFQEQQAIPHLDVRCGVRPRALPPAARARGQPQPRRHEAHHPTTERGGTGRPPLPSALHSCTGVTSSTEDVACDVRSSYDWWWSVGQEIEFLKRNAEDTSSPSTVNSGDPSPAAAAGGANAAVVRQQQRDLLLLQKENADLREALRKQVTGCSP